MKFFRENHLGIEEFSNSGLLGSEEEEAEDYFDQLPDALLQVIFNKLLDAKSLVRCLSVSKRFNSLIPQTDAVFLRLPRQIPTKKPTSTNNASPTKLFKNLLKNLITKPIRFLHNIAAINKSSPNSRTPLYYLPHEALKGFKQMKSLHLELPCCNDGEAGSTEKDSLLKWKAEFGTNLKSCVIIGANSFAKGASKNGNLGKENDSRNCESNQPILADEELKRRIVWMISSLIAASARHYLLKRVVADFPVLSNVVVSDVDRRGKLFMKEEELAELRSNSESNDSSSAAAMESSLERSLIPDLSMKLWYVPRLELPSSGWVMEGATLVVIRPLDHGGVMIRKGSCGGDDVDGDLMRNGFDGDEEEKAILGEAVTEMMKMKKMYVMEMTSF